MPTNKTRLNITLSPEVETVIKKLAERDKTSRAGKVTGLLRVALEIEEDRAWNKLAEKRDKKTAKFLTHKKSWV